VEIATILRALDTGDMENLHSRGADVRQAILAARLPEELEFAIIDAYERLRGSDLHAPDVAVRSSATAEDLPDASFAGQQETYLNVQVAVD
jgi:pyruvate,water dikinase